MSATGHNISPFTNHKDMYNKIDAICVGKPSWSTYHINLTSGDNNDNAPAWAQESYVLRAQDSLQVVWTMLDNPEFDGHFDTRAYWCYVKNLVTGTWERELSDVMSVQWAWRQLV
jgi:hypothetical protein